VIAYSHPTWDGGVEEGMLMIATEDDELLTR
jgi:hypothetical protein